MSTAEKWIPWNPATGLALRYSLYLLEWACNESRIILVDNPGRRHKLHIAFATEDNYVDVLADYSPHVVALTEDET